MRIVGIFNSWEIHFTKSTIQDLRDNFLQNPYYPFNKVENSNSFILDDKVKLRDWYYFAFILIFLISGFYFISQIINLTIWHDFATLMVIVFLGLLYLFYAKLQSKKLVVDLRTLTYTYIRCNNIIYQGALNEVYIRLEHTKFSSKLYYVIKIGGHRIKPIYLCKASCNLKALKIFATQIALRLNLNYFDFTDSSTEHIIRHK
ncbi:unnamed protein product [Gordionus sp. m RMFG-2023]